MSEALIAARAELMQERDKLNVAIEVMDSRLGPVEHWLLRQPISATPPPVAMKVEARLAGRGRKPGRKAKATRAGGRLPSPSAATNGGEEEPVLRVLLDAGKPLALREIAERMGISTSGSDLKPLSYRLRILFESGKVKKSGIRAGTRYECRPGTKSRRMERMAAPTEKEKEWAKIRGEMKTEEKTGE